MPEIRAEGGLVARAVLARVAPGLVVALIMVGRGVAVMPGRRAI